MNPTYFQYLEIFIIRRRFKLVDSDQFRINPMPRTKLMSALYKLFTTKHWRKRSDVLRKRKQASPICQAGQKCTSEVRSAANWIIMAIIHHPYDIILEVKTVTSAWKRSVSLP
jgi:hypothetical protein